jgi:hypothetical protein
MCFVNLIECHLIVCVWQRIFFFFFCLFPLFVSVLIQNLNKVIHSFRTHSFSPFWPPFSLFFPIFSLRVNVTKCNLQTLQQSYCRNSICS